MVSAYLLLLILQALRKGSISATPRQHSLIVGPIGSALHLDAPAAAGSSCLGRGRCLKPDLCGPCAAARCCSLPEHWLPGWLCRGCLWGPVLCSHAKHGLHLLRRELYVLQQERQPVQVCTALS